MSGGAAMQEALFVQLDAVLFRQPPQGAGGRRPQQAGMPAKTAQEGQGCLEAQVRFWALYFISASDEPSSCACTDI